MTLPTHSSHLSGVSGCQADFAGRDARGPVRHAWSLILGLVLLVGVSADLAALDGVQTPRTLDELSALYPDLDTDGIPYNDGWATEIGYGYQEYLPDGYGETDQQWPLFIYFGGAGERGSGNQPDLNNGTLKWGPSHEINLNGTDYPAVIITPQSPAWFTYEATKVNRFITFLISEYQVDPRRVYFAGLCTGGGGVMTIASYAPERIAAIGPSITQSSTTDWPYPNDGVPFVGLPTWIFHSFNDASVSRNFSIYWTNAISAAYPPTAVGSQDCMDSYPHLFGNPNWHAGRHLTGRFRPETGWQWIDGVSPGDERLMFTLYANGDHNCWQPTLNNPNFLHWLFAQRLQGPFGAEAIAIPGCIEAEGYDHGGFMRAYSDSDGVNTGNSLAHAVPNDIDGVLDDGAVDLFEDGSSTWLGDTVVDEWVEWTLAVSAPATYDLEVVVAAEAVGGAFDLTLDGSPMASFVVPDTAGAWTTLSLPVSLDAGEQILRLSVTGGGFLLDKICIELGSDPINMIVDNLDPGLSTTGQWNAGMTSNPQYYGSDYLTGYVGSESTAVFTAALPRESYYEVYAWYPANEYYGNLPVTILHADGSYATAVNQKTGGGAWQSLGVYRFGPGQAATVTFSALEATGFGCSIDAVRFQEVEELPLVELIVDDIDTGNIVSTGSWNVGVTSNPEKYGASYFTGTPGSASTLVYSPSLPRDGIFEVSVWFPSNQYYGLLGVTIDHRDGTLQTMIDESSDGGAWQVLGTWHFEAAGPASVSFDASTATGYGLSVDAVRFRQVESLPPVEPIDLIIDNNSVGRVDRVGNWGTSSSTAGFFGDNYNSIAPGTLGAEVRYLPLLSRDALCEIHVWYPAHPFYGVVPIEIVPGDGSPSVVTSMDQTATGGQWVLIDTVPLSAGSDAAIIIHAEGATGFSTVADAIRLIEYSDDG